MQCMQSMDAFPGHGRVPVPGNGCRAASAPDSHTVSASCRRDRVTGPGYSAAPRAGAGTGRLRFNWSNVCMHYFSAAFLADMARRMRAEARYHLARKAIPSVSGPVKARPRPGPVAARRPHSGRCRRQLQPAGASARTMQARREGYASCVVLPKAGHAAK